MSLKDLANVQITTDPPYTHKSKPDAHKPAHVYTYDDLMLEVIKPRTPMDEEVRNRILRGVTIEVRPPTFGDVDVGKLGSMVHNEVMRMYAHGLELAAGADVDRASGADLDAVAHAALTDVTDEALRARVKSRLVSEAYPLDAEVFADPALTEDPLTVEKLAEARDAINRSWLGYQMGAAVKGTEIRNFRLEFSQPYFIRGGQDFLGNGSKYVEMRMHVLDREYGTPTTVIHKAGPFPEDMPDAACVRVAMLECAEHEIDESIHENGRRVKDPHL